MKQRGMIRYLHMGCGESLAARQLGNMILEDNAALRQMKTAKAAVVEERRRKNYEEQR
ncbi:hypothetical protein [Thiolapillus sp.]